MKVISLINQKGGSGKTTLAINLSMVLPKSILIDLDPQQSSAETTGCPYVQKDLDKFLGSLKGYQFAILDTPPRENSIIREAILYADLNLVPLSDSPLDFRAAEMIIDLVKQVKRKTAFVLNRVQVGSAFVDGFQKDLEKAYGVPVLKTIIHNRAMFRKSLIDGKPVSGKGGEEVRNLAKEILKRLKVKNVKI